MPERNRAGRAENRVALDNATWAVLLACVAVLPLVTSITRGIMGPSWALTAEPYHLPKLTALASLTSIATLLWIADHFCGRQIRAGAVLAPLGIFALLIAVSTAFAIEPVSSLFGASGLMTGAVTWLLCGWFAFLLLQYLSSAARLRQLSWSLVTGCALVAAIGLLGTLRIDPLGTPYTGESQWRVLQAMSTTGNPDFTGILLIVPAVVGLALALSSVNSRMRLLAYALTSVMLVASFVTLTRASWLGVLIGVLTLLLLSAVDRTARKRRLLYAGAATATIALLGLALAENPSLVISRIGRIAQGLNSFTSGRIDLWTTTLRVVAKYPLLGTGADHLALGAYPVQRDIIIEDGARYVLQDPHSLPLLVAAVFGVPALIALAALVAMTLRSAWRRGVSSSDSGTGRTLFAGWYWGFAGLLLASLLSVWTITAIFVFFIAIAVLISPTMESCGDGGPVPLKAVAAIGLVIVSTSLYGTTRAITADRHVILARTGNAEMHYAKAIDLVPWDAWLRVDYFGKKIDAYRPYLAGADPIAARAAADEVDSQLASAIGRFPDELQFYRQRVYMLRLSQGAPGYQAEKEAAAIDEALDAFPGDTEFLELKRSLVRPAR